MSGIAEVLNNLGLHRCGLDSAESGKCRASRERGTHKVYDGHNAARSTARDVVVVSTASRRDKSGIDGGARAAHSVVRRAEMLRD